MKYQKKGQGASFMKKRTLQGFQRPLHLPKMKERGRKQSALIRRLPRTNINNNNQDKKKQKNQKKSLASGTAQGQIKIENENKKRTAEKK